MKLFRTTLVLITLFFVHSAVKAAPVTYEDIPDAINLYSGNDDYLRIVNEDYVHIDDFSTRQGKRLGEYDRKHQDTYTARTTNFRVVFRKPPYYVRDLRIGQKKVFAFVNFKEALCGEVGFWTSDVYMGIGEDYPYACIGKDEKGSIRPQVFSRHARTISRLPQEIKAMGANIRGEFWGISDWKGWTVASNACSPYLDKTCPAQTLLNQLNIKE